MEFLELLLGILIPIQVSLIFRRLYQWKIWRTAFYFIRHSNGFFETLRNILIVLVVFVFILALAVGAVMAVFMVADRYFLP